MTAVLVGSHAPGSAEWHELRAQGIGGSEISAVVGLNPWMSAFELWHRKKGNLPEREITSPMGWGTRLEPIIADHFHEQHPRYAPYDESGTFAHPDRPWQIANPDGLLYWDMDGSLESLLEVKTARFPDGWGRDGSDVIPIAYRCQVTWYMDVLGVDHAWVAALIGGNDYREYRIGFDDGDARELRDAGEAFWESLAADEEPPIDCSDSTYQTVRALNPDIDRDETADVSHLWTEFSSTAAAKEKWEGAHRRARARVLDEMGNARVAVVDGLPRLRRQPNGRGGISLHEIKE